MLGDANGCFTYPDFLDGYNHFEDSVGHPPTKVVVCRGTLDDLRTDSLFVHQNEVYGGGDAQFHDFNEQVEGGVGLYCETPVHKFTDNRWLSEKRFAVFTDGSASVRVVG